MHSCQRLSITFCKSFISACLAVLLSGIVAAAVEPDATPCDPKATPATRKVLEYLARLPANGDTNRIVVGQLAAHISSDGSKPARDNFDEWKRRLGTYPGIYHWEARWNYGGIGFQRYTELSIEAWQGGSLVAIGWTAQNLPVPGATLKDVDSTYRERNQKAYDVFWNGWVEELAGYLQQLQDAGVVVLLRPFHEPEGRAWIRSGKQSFPTVWEQLFRHLTEEKKLHNIIFVLGLDKTLDKDYLPDPRYVDIVGTSEYVNPPYQAAHFVHLQKLHSRYPGKPVAICEFGSHKNKQLPADAKAYLDAIKKYAPFVSYMSWWHEHTDYQWACYQSKRANAYVADPWIITQDEISTQLPRIKAEEKPEPDLK